MSHNKEELKDKSRQLISLFEEISALLKQIEIDPEEAQHKKQLRGISRMISSFERRGVQVPAELRNLKASLVNKLTESEDISIIINEIYSEINKNFPGITKNHIKKAKRSYSGNANRSQSSIKLIELIDAGLIEPNTKIFHKSRKYSFDGIILKNGQISINIKGEDKLFDSLSMAAVAYKNRPINGWYFWKVTKNGRDIKLRELRQEYFDNSNKTS